MIDENLVLEIKWVSPFKKSIKNEGYYQTVTFTVIDGDYNVQPHTNLDNNNRNYKNWKGLLKEGNILTGFIWKDKTRGLIDADSPIRLV